MAGVWGTSVIPLTVTHVHASPSSEATHEPTTGLNSSRANGSDAGQNAAVLQDAQQYCADVLRVRKGGRKMLVSRALRVTNQAGIPAERVLSGNPGPSWTALPAKRGGSGEGRVSGRCWGA